MEYDFDDSGKLTEILHAGTTYSFLYDIFGNKTSTQVGSRTLATYTYGANNGNLMRLTYGNGNRVDYTYDRFGNYATVAFNGTVVMKNFADSRGDIVRTEDLRTNLEHRVTYDSTGRLISKDTLNLATASHTTDRWLRSMEYDYDRNNNLTKLAYADTNGSNVTTYTYGEDNLPQTATFKGRINNEDVQLVYSYSYDKLGRLINTELPLGTNTLTSAYTYASSVRGSEYTTTKLYTETVGGKTYRYAYDALGNITRLYSVNGSTETLLHLYTYDNNSQLTADMNSVDGTITDYSYDYGGNILQVKVSAWDGNTSNPVRGTEISRNTYSYTDDEWADLLTSYNGQTITYDAIGNPLNYRDGISLTWQNGRELATYADSAKSVAYSYDASGMRTGKTVTKSSGATTAYTYVYENGLLLQMSRGARFYDFSYDANGRPLSIAYRSQAEATPIYYYYALNSRGDVIGLYNSSGNIAALYDYDAYGKLLSVKTATGISITADTDVAIVNPLRYRSYVYDTETGLYYLQSRYYDPTTCRFVNGDDPAYMGIGSINSYNLYSYCSNNPISFCDTSGTTYTYSGYTSTGKYFTGVPTYQLGYLGQLSNYWLDVDSVSLPIGGAVTVSNDFLDITLETIFFGIETGSNDSYIANGNFDKPITFYVQKATEWWRLSEYRAGVSVNIYGFGCEFSVSPLSLYSSFTARNFNLELQNGLDKVGFTATLENDYRNHTMGEYLHCYYRPWTVAPVVAAACYTYGVAGSLLFAPSLCFAN